MVAAVYSLIIKPPIIATRIFLLILNVYVIAYLQGTTFDEFFNSTNVLWNGKGLRNMPIYGVKKDKLLM